MNDNDEINVAMAKIIVPYLLEKEQEHDKWREEIPYLQFPTDWLVKAIPSFDAIVRYNIKKGENMVSIYLDCYDKLGYVGEPYWEILKVGGNFKDDEGDPERFLLNETDELLKAISKLLED